MAGNVNISGTDIRRYRTTLDLHQTQFAKGLGISQAALSLIEKGKTAVSTEHVDRLRRHFAAPKFDPSFEDFEKRLDQERKSVMLGKAARRNHLTITVWRWEEGIDPGDGFRADQAADVVTIRQPNRRVIAFLMTRKSDYWAEDEIIVFEEARPADLNDRDLCLVYHHAPRSENHQAMIAVAHVLPTKRGSQIQYQPISPAGPTFDHDTDQVRQVARVFFRGGYANDHKVKEQPDDRWESP